MITQVQTKTEQYALDLVFIIGEALNVFTNPSSFYHGGGIVQ